MLIVKNIENNTMYNMQELHLSSFLPTTFTSSIIIDIHLRVVVLTKLDKTITLLNIFFQYVQTFFIRYYFSSLNTYEYV